MERAGDDRRGRRPSRLAACAAAAEQVARLQQHAEEASAAVERHCERDQRYFGEESERRWHKMGLFRQMMHRSAHTDRFMLAYADRRRGLAAEIAALAPYRAEFARRRPEAEKRAAVSLASAQPKAAAELARRREHAGLARTVLEERHQNERAQHRARGHEQKRGRGLGLGL